MERARKRRQTERETRTGMERVLLWDGGMVFRRAMGMATLPEAVSPGQWV